MIIHLVWYNDNHFDDRYGVTTTTTKMMNYIDDDTCIDDDADGTTQRLEILFDQPPIEDRWPTCRPAKPFERFARWRSDRARRWGWSEATRRSMSSWNPQHPFERMLLGQLNRAQRVETLKTFLQPGSLFYDLIILITIIDDGHLLLMLVPALCFECFVHLRSIFSLVSFRDHSD